MNKPVSRRRFLKRLALGGAIVGTGVGSGLHRPLLRRLGWGRARVGLVKCSGYGAGLRSAVEAAWNAGDGPAVSGLKVLIKPNLIDHREDSVISTNSRLIDALIGFLQDNGAREVSVAEGPGNRRDLTTVADLTGLSEKLERRNVRLIDLNIDALEVLRTRTVPVEQPSRIQELFVPRSWLEADVTISIPKLKMHHWAGVTLSMKNLFGVVPGSQYGWPKNILHWNGIDRSILELTATLRPSFALVDGIVGMEGDGPLAGDPREVGALISGRDLVAVDAVACRLMGMDPGRILHLAAAQDLGLGMSVESGIQVVGEPIKALAQMFREPPDWPVT